MKHSPDPEPYTFQYGGSTYRFSIVGGLYRFEQQLPRDRWYLIEPSHDTTAAMVGMAAVIEQNLSLRAALEDFRGELVVNKHRFDVMMQYELSASMRAMCADAFQDIEQTLNDHPALSPSTEEVPK